MEPVQPHWLPSLHWLFLLSSWSVSWFRGAPCFSPSHHVALTSLALSLGHPPHRLGQAATGAPGDTHHPGWTSPAPSGVCSDHPAGLCLVLPQCLAVWLESGGSNMEAVSCCRLWSKQRGIMSCLNHPAVLLLMQSQSLPGCQGPLLVPSHSVPRLNWQLHLHS